MESAMTLAEQILDIKRFLDEFNCNERYSKRYLYIIQRFEEKSSDFEKHHIIPKSLGGTNEKNNIVLLSKRAHFLAHFLLWKMMPHKTEARKKMSYAFNQMKRCSTNSRLYAMNKKEHSKNVSEQKKGNTYCLGKITCYDPNTLKQHRLKTVPENYVIGMSPKVKEIHKQRHRNKIKINNGLIEKWHQKDIEIPEGWSIGRTPKFKQLVSNSSKGNKSNTGRRYQRTEEQKKKISESKRGLLPPNTGMHQYHCPLSGKRIWAKECPENFMEGWGESFKESIKRGMKH